MASFDQSCRVAIVGAASLRGKELNQLLGESPFPAADIRLLDDDTTVGLLTEAGGEPTFVQQVEEESFAGARFVFFAGSREFTARHWPAARRAGATVIDLSEELAAVPAAVPWIPALDSVLPPPLPTVGSLFFSPGAAAMVGCTLAAALVRFSAARLVIMLFRPAAECGQAGIDELESQTVNLLSFQPVARDVFDAQVAFNFLARYGDASLERLSDVRAAIARDVSRYLAGRVPVPAIQLVQAPVFYSYTFAAFAELAAPVPEAEIERALVAAGARIAAPDEQAPSNIGVAGGGELVMSPVERDPHVAAGYWFWGAADNIRFAAANALRIASELLRAVS
jgi:aspartate-semialdehyde dehydrogenase